MSGPEPRAEPLAVRILETIAGLLSGGLVVLGTVLLVVQTVASWPDGGQQPPAGPGWPAVAAHLALGAAGEAARYLRRRFTPGVRAAIAAAVIAATAALIVAFWWR